MGGPCNFDLSNMAIIKKVKCLTVQPATGPTVYCQRLP